MLIIGSEDSFKAHVPAKEFINRDKPRNFFYTSLENFSVEKKKVIAYYGIGGIGKSSLVQNLQDYVCKQEILYTFVDFDDPAFRLPFKALIELKKNSNIPMPHFDVAAAMCFIKRNPEIRFNEKGLSENTIFKLVQTFSSLEPTGIFGSLIGLTELIYEKSASKLKLDKDVKNHLKNLEIKSANEIENELPDYFAYDVTQFLIKKQNKCCVIFFDTYELLWDKGKNDSNKLNNDSWVRRLFSKLPYTLFVISGREKLQWELEEPIWAEQIQYVPIDILDPDFVIKYLNICKIDDPDIQQKIIESTKGHPYYLDLSVDTYYRLLNAGENIDINSFGQGRREIQERFLKNLSDSEINMLKALVISRFYDSSIFEYLIDVLHTGYSIVKMDDFNSYSFVKTDTNNKFYIHILMRDEIKRHMPEDLRKLVHSKMLNYYEKQLDNDTLSSIYIDDLKYLFSELLYHAENSLASKEIVAYIEQKQLMVINRFQVSGETNYLLANFQEMFYVNKSNVAGTKFFSIMVDMIHLSGKYSEAVKIISEHLGSFSLNEVVESEYLLDLFIRKVHHMMFYTPLKTLMYEMDKILNVLSNNETMQTQYCEILFMLGAHVYLPLEDLQNAQKNLVKSIRIARKTENNSLICRCLRKYSELLCVKNRYVAAEKVCKMAIKIAMINSLDRYELYLNCVLAEIHRLNGATNEAKRLFEEMLPIASSMGIKGWVGHINLSLGNCYVDLNDYTFANEYYGKALEIYLEIGQIWGEISSKLMIHRLFLISKNTIDTDALDQLLIESNRLGYNTLSKYIENTKEGKINVIHFNFM